MLSIADGGSLARALAAPIDPRLKRLLADRRDQLGGDIAGKARFVIAQPGDRVPDVERELGFSPLTNPVGGARYPDPEFAPFWEWIEDHGGLFELVFVFTDDGFAHVLLVEDREGVDPDVLGLCRRFAQQPAAAPATD